MGRIKRGLDYFPMSTDFIHDRMVRRLMKHEGDSAFAILVETLSYIYAGQGYYIRADDEFYDELSDNLYNVNIEDVKRIIALAVEYKLFDLKLFQEHTILTSADIQRQYLFVTKRRSGSQIDAAYCLLDDEELASYRSSGTVKSTAKQSVAVAGERITNESVEEETYDVVASNAGDVTVEPEIAAVGTQNKREQSKTNENKINNLPNPPQGGDGGGRISKKRKELTQEDIDNLQPPNDGVPRNFRGLLDNLRAYGIPPMEQYAIILRSNYGVIGNVVWKGIGTIRGSNGKIKLPGHYLLSVVNK